MFTPSDSAASALMLATLIDVIAACVLLYVACAVLRNAAGQSVGPLRSLAAVLAFAGALSQIVLGVADLVLGISLVRAIGARLSGAVCLVVAVLLLRAAFRREDTTLVGSLRAQYKAIRQARSAHARAVLDRSQGPSRG